MTLVSNNSNLRRLGIVIVNYNTWYETKRCVESIRNSKFNQSYRIYIIDNASPLRPDAEITYFLNATDIEYICNPKNTGYAAGNNVGIKNAINDGCTEILISNSDILFQEHSISKLIEALATFPDVGIVGPQILNLDGTTDNRNIFAPMGIKEKYLVTTRLSLIAPKFKKQFFGLNMDKSKSIYVHAVSGCCLMLSRNCALEVTPFDENTFLYEEEYILGRMMIKSSFKTLYEPSAVIIHAHGSSTINVKAFSFICFVSSEIYYCKKYLGASVFQILPLYIIRTFSYFIRALKNKDFRKNIINYFKSTKLLWKSNLL